MTDGNDRDTAPETVQRLEEVIRERYADVPAMEAEEGSLLVDLMRLHRDLTGEDLAG